MRWLLMLALMAFAPLRADDPAPPPPEEPGDTLEEPPEEEEEPLETKWGRFPPNRVPGRGWWCYTPMSAPDDCFTRNTAWEKDT